MSQPDSPLLCYYGDDFTGSTDVMEALTLAGARTLLFLEPPSAERLARLGPLHAVGVAGRGRALTPEEMEAELPPIFRSLRDLRPRLVHYKTCSTFDSSPEIGSIGRAIDLGQAVFGSLFVPLVVGAPSLRRYCVFGHLFASSGLESGVYRLDRHPTMSQHPTTPMGESDIRLHLARQTDRPAGLLDVVQLAAPDAEARLDALLQGGSEIVLFDILTEEHLRRAGELIWRRTAPEAALFAAGSSGLEYALTAHWQEAGLLPQPAPLPPVGAVSQVVVVSGSCSPVTEQQVAWAASQGFAERALRPEGLLEPVTAQAEQQDAVEWATRAIAEGRSVILHTARGPHDERIAAMDERLKQLRRAGGEQPRTAELLGRSLGRILRAVLERTGLPRAATTGGDSSSYIALELGVEALEMAAPCAPGSPLCRLLAPGSPLDRREIVFKGGQVGRVQFFRSVLSGRS